MSNLALALDPFGSKTTTGLNPFAGKNNAVVAFNPLPGGVPTAGNSLAGRSNTTDGYNPFASRTGPDGYSPFAVGSGTIYAKNPLPGGTLTSFSAFEPITYVTGYGRNPFPGGVATGFAPFAAPTNLAPTVDAGPDQLVAYPATVNLDGTVTDDGQPPPGTLTTTWSKISGPGNVTFGDASAVDTTADFDAAGVYVLQLLADDSELQSADTVTITANAAPTVDAGPDQIIVLPAVANLDGTVSDDGLPNPPAALTTMWTKFSGPGNVVFGDASAVDTTATFDLDGVYVLQLEADDSHLQTTDTVTITVGAAPVVESGFPQAGFKAGAFETANFEDADFK